MTKSFRSNCPINQLLELLGDNWSLLIIRDMLFFQKISYGDFISSEEQISTNILASRLKQLEAGGMIEKRQSKQDRKKYIYLLTDKGLKLGPILAEMLLWGVEHSPLTLPLPEKFINGLRKDRDKAVAQVVESYMGMKKVAITKSE